jgi:hypothetical protein
MMFTKNVYLDKKLSIIIDYIKSVKGIEYVKPLNNNEKKTILPRRGNYEKVQPLDQVSI